MQRKEESKKSVSEKTVESSLLRTYFVSLFSCLICCIMFLGTTYAWFSGSLTSSSNQIRAGALQIQLLHEGTDIVQNPKHVVFSTGVLAPDNRDVTEKLTLRNISEISINYDLRLVVAQDAGNIKQHFTVSTSADGNTWTVPEPLENGLSIGTGTLAGKQGDIAFSADIFVRLILDTNAPDIQGKEMSVVLDLLAQQALSGGGTT